MTFLINLNFHIREGGGETLGDRLAEEASSRADTTRDILELREESNPSMQEQLETAAKENQGLGGYEDSDYCETCDCSPCRCQ